MRKTIICIIVCLFSVALYGQQPENNPKQFPSAADYANTKLTYKIIDAPGHTYCYDVYANDKLMIHQTSIPGLPGNKGFKTKADAEKVAQLVISKIKKGEMPPTVSAEEMKKLKVI